MVKRLIKTIVIVIAIIILIFSGGYYVITNVDALNDSSDSSNVPNVTQTTIDEIENNNRDEYGNLKTRVISKGYCFDIDIDEAVKNIIEKTSKVNGGRIEDYLPNTSTREDTLKKMIKAELITKYPNVRNRENLNTEVDQDEFQGALKFTRFKEDGTDIQLEYIPIEKFNEMMSVGDNNIINYFSLNEKDELVVVYYNKTYEIEFENSKGLGTQGISYGYNEANGDTIESNIYKDYRHTEDLYTVNIQTEAKNVINSNEAYTYTYRIKTINYRELLSKYNMTFDYLWAFLVMGNDEEFINDLADLVLNSSITIGIYDNVNITETEVINGYNINTFRFKKDENLEEGNTNTSYEANVDVTQNYSIKYKKEYTNSINFEVIDANIWFMRYKASYTLNSGTETNPNLTEYSFERIQNLDGIFNRASCTGDTQITSDEEGNTVSRITTETSTTKNQNFTSTFQNQQIKTYVSEGSPEIKEKTDKNAEEGDEDYPNFCTILLRSKYARSNLIEIPEWLFYVIERNEKTVDMLSLTKYLFYCVYDKDYGVKEFNFNFYDLKSFTKTTTSNGLAAYLLIFSHGVGYHAPMSDDGRFYKMYGDGAGWPTIGDADLQWASHHGSFNVSGKVLINGVETEVPSIEAYVNSYLTRGVGAEYSKQEVSAMNIYVEKEIVDEVGTKVRNGYYNAVKNCTSELSLSEQQLYALTAIMYNFGHLPTRNGYTFKSAYLAGAALYEINSWEHNKFIWDNWWSYVRGGYEGLIPARDAQFETYVKGVYSWSENLSALFGRKQEYIYYTPSQLAQISYAPKFTCIRTAGNEKNIFTYEEHSAGGSIIEAAELIHQHMEDNKYVYSLNTLELPETSENAWELRTCCCATFVDWVLIEAGYQESHTLIHHVVGIFDTYLDKFEVIENPSDLQPGDITFHTDSKGGGIYKEYKGRGIYLGHVQIYAGNGTWYNAGSTNIIQCASPYSGPVPSTFVIAFRPK